VETAGIRLQIDRLKSSTVHAAKVRIPRGKAHCEQGGIVV
jgi:hypothetical protein